MNCAASFHALASLAFVQETRTGFRAEGDLVPPFFHTFFMTSDDQLFFKAFNKKN